MAKRRKLKITNKRGKKVHKAKTQEELELAYHRAWGERPDNIIAFPSEGPMPVPSKDSELYHHWSEGHWTDEPFDSKTYFPDLDDNVPDFLRSSAVDKPTEDVQEHKVPEELIGKARRVTLLKDHTLEHPLLGLAVYVAPDPCVADDEARFAKMFARAYCHRAKELKNADLVVFAGGSDVDPQLYGQEPHESSYWDIQRDYTDGQIFDYCLANGIAMFGVCRGAQYLHVRNGGSLFQDVDGHCGPHTMFDIRGQTFIEKVSSVHHQMCMENIKGGMEIIATSALSNTRATGKSTYDVGKNADIEAYFYRETCCIGVQGHPEYEGYNFYTNWCLELINELVYCNPDFDWIENRLRMRPEILEQRTLQSLPILLNNPVKGVK